MKLYHLYLSFIFWSFYPKIFAQQSNSFHLFDIRRQEEFIAFISKNNINVIVDTLNGLSEKRQNRQAFYQESFIYEFDSFGVLKQCENWINVTDLDYLNKELHFDTLTPVLKDEFNNYEQLLKIDSFVVRSTYFIDERGRKTCDAKMFLSFNIKSYYLSSLYRFNDIGDFSHHTIWNDGWEEHNLNYQVYDDLDFTYENNQIIFTENGLRPGTYSFPLSTKQKDTCSFQSKYKQFINNFLFIKPNDSIVFEYRIEPHDVAWFNWTNNHSFLSQIYKDRFVLDPNSNAIVHFNLINSENKTVQHKISKVDIKKQDYFRMHQQFADSANQFYFPETFGNNFFTVFERDTVNNEIYITEYNYKFDNKLNQTLKIFGGMEVRDFSNHLLKYYRGKVDNQYWFIENLDGYILDEYTYNGDEIVAYTLKISKEPKFRKIADPLKLKYKTVLKKPSKNKQIMPLEPRFKIENKELGILKIDGRLYQFKTY